MSNRDVSEIVRADILRILWKRGDAPGVLRASDLSVPEYGSYLVDSARWLEAEGLVRLGRCHSPVNSPGSFSNASLTAKGESLLRYKSHGEIKALGDLISEAFRDAAKDGVKEAIRHAPKLLWTALEAWKTAPP